jgi:pilus assembly protein CpaE
MAEKVAGYEAGADDYLPKTIEPKELELRIKALLARSQQLGHLQMQPQAKVVTVFSLRGGVGTTSVAVNLAVELARQRQQEIGLIDLSLRNGHCALLLNVKPKWTIADIQSRQGPILDTEVIDQILLKHATGVRLMPAPLTAAESELITVAGIDQIWPYMYATFPFLIVDGGSQLVEPTLTVLERSHAILLLIPPELASLKSAADALRILEQLKIDLAQVYPIINRTFPNHGLAKKDIENVLGHPIKAIIPYDSNAVIQAINTGKPAVTADPKSEFSQAINQLADSMNALSNKPILSLLPKPKSKRSKGTGILRLSNPAS